MTPTRWAAVVIVTLAIVFAVMGGEYSIRDWYTMRGQVREQRALVAQLERTVDSLDSVATAIETDPRVQERVARESFGMIRQGEYLYKLVPE